MALLAAVPSNPSELETSPSKRHREGEAYSNDDSVPSDFIHSPDIWMDDGNIILVCAGVGYRVHRSVLSSHSTIFRDMFEHSTPSEEETVEGCVVLHLQDTCEDMGCLLRMLYFRRYGQPKHGTPLSVVGSSLRMARKYMVDELREEAIEHLEFLFPSTIEVYKSSERVAALPSFVNPMFAVELSLEFDIPSILPVTLYLSALLPLDTKLDGFEMPDIHGTRVKPPPEVLYRILFFELEWRKSIDTLNDVSGWFGTEACRASERNCEGLDETVKVPSRIWYSQLSEDVFLEDFDPFHRTCQRCISRFEADDEALKVILWDRLPCFVTSDWKRWADVPRRAVSDTVYQSP